MKRIGLAIAAVAVVALGFLAWYALGNRGSSTPPTDQQVMADGSLDESAGLGFGAGPTRKSGGTVVNYTPPPLWATRDIHEIPLGTILDYAVEVVQYDNNRARYTLLPRNSRGQSPYITVTPAQGVWGMNRATLREGHIVAKIESEGDYLDLGIVSGLNVLWVGNDPNGKLEWVLVPGTAFAPLKNISETEARTIFRQQDQVSLVRVRTRDL